MTGLHSLPCGSAKGAVLGPCSVGRRCEANALSDCKSAGNCCWCCSSEMALPSCRFLLLNINQLGVAAATSIQKLGLLEGKPEV